MAPEEQSNAKCWIPGASSGCRVTGMNRCYKTVLQQFSLEIGGQILPELYALQLAHSMHARH